MSADSLTSTIAETVSAVPDHDVIAREAAIRQWLIEHCAAVSGITLDRLDPTLPFASYGLGSVQAVSLAGDLEEWVGAELPATLLWDYPTINQLAAYLARSHGA